MVLSFLSSIREQFLGQSEASIKGIEKYPGFPFNVAATLGFYNWNCICNSLHYPRSKCIAYSISSVAETRERALSFTREVELVR